MEKNLCKIKTRDKKRIARGAGSGSGTTAGRGTKGQKSRSGASVPAHFQGGGIALWQHLPKRDGIKSRNKRPIILNVDQLEKHFSSDEIITLDSLEKKGLVKAALIDRRGLKILARGGNKTKLKFDPSLITSKKLRN